MRDFTFDLIISTARRCKRVSVLCVCVCLCGSADPMKRDYTHAWPVLSRNARAARFSDQCPYNKVYFLNFIFGLAPRARIVCADVCGALFAGSPEPAALRQIRNVARPSSHRGARPLNKTCSRIVVLMPQHTRCARARYTNWRQFPICNSLIIRASAAQTAQQRVGVCARQHVTKWWKRVKLQSSRKARRR